MKLREEKAPPFLVFMPHQPRLKRQRPSAQIRFQLEQREVLKALVVTAAIKNQWDQYEHLVNNKTTPTPRHH